MAQRYIKSAGVRDLTLMDIACKSEEECYDFYKEYVWGDSGQQICSHCGVIDFHYHRPKRKQWRCKHCDGYFSVTTGTLFQDRKLKFKTILMGIMYLVSSASGTSLHEFSRDLNVQIKTAMVFVGKFREVICKNQSTEQFKTFVQMDGGYFGGRPRHGRLRRKYDPKVIADHVEAKFSDEKPAKRKPRNRIAYLNWKRLDKRRIIIVIRECYVLPGLGAKRTRVEICMSENSADVNEIAKRYIEPGTYIMTDEGSGFSSLKGCGFEHDAVAHAIEFSSIDGINDNQAESYFSRMRRYVKGVGLKSPLTYLYDTATEMAWREDVRKWTLKAKFDAILKGSIRHGLSRWWRGYWQGYKRGHEILWADRVK